MNDPLDNLKIVLLPVVNSSHALVSDLMTVMFECAVKMRSKIVFL